MKTIQLSSILLFTQNPILSMDITPRKFNSLIQLVYNKLEGVSNDGYNKINNKLKNYGCHCFSSDTKKPTIGGGAPVDEIDAACKQLAICRACLNDYEIENNLPRISDAANVRYKYQMIGDDSKIISCDNQARDSQQDQAVCECDKQFADAVAEAYNSWDARFWYARKNTEDHFSQDEMCQVSPSANSRNLQCCGNWPMPATYYNPMTAVCCDGTVTATGTC